jgi:hypothetical protein
MVAAAGLAFCATPPRPSESGAGEELARIEALCRTAQPAIAASMGYEAGPRVPVVVRSRSEVKAHLVEVIDLEYPDAELELRSRCFAELGLVGRGDDLRAALIAMLDEQAGGLYDPYSKVFVAIADLPPELRSEPAQRLIVGHELAHALQDRDQDLLAQMTSLLADLDREFAYRAVVEGTAMVAAWSFMVGAPLDALGDVGATLRAGFEQYNLKMPAFAGAPAYLQELLLSPYDVGSSFVQSFLSDHDSADLADLFDHVPVSSEQVLHYERFVAGDLPHDIDLGDLTSLLPADWSALYENSLGELDLRSLFAEHDRTRADAVDLASGWDGLRFRAFETDGGELVVVGASVWDSPADAEEFAEAFRVVLADIHGSDAFEVAVDGGRVAFVTGVGDPDRRAMLLEAALE